MCTIVPQIHPEARILHANPRRYPLLLTCWTPEIVPCAVCNAELTDEVPVIAAWIAVQMACDTFG